MRRSIWLVPSLLRRIYIISYQSAGVFFPSALTMSTGLQMHREPSRISETRSEKRQLSSTTDEDDLKAEHETVDIDDHDA